MSVAQPLTAAFDGIAAQYDEIFTESLIGRAQRDAVWQIAIRHLRPGNRVLELNCGTGKDALFLASNGMSVVACDISPAMIGVARNRKERDHRHADINFRVLSIESLGALPLDNRYDAVFSNFSGLNCVADLASVASDLARLTNPGAKAILCLSSKYCLWEFCWYLFHGQIKRATRRWNRDAITARIGDGSVEVRYPRVGEILASFSEFFSPVAIHGVGVAVPPSYLEPWARRMPAAVAALARIDRVISGRPLWRSMGDHVVLVLERIGA
jgi:ubiquinone/menaquinone biosynthesis C-methylase UbiE